jgi:predicted dehydrogenase/nucleoside-diphosphate-sugar epimerase
MASSVAGGEANRLRVGLIGSGKMGLQHLKAIGASGRATVVGVADPAADREQLNSYLPPETPVFATAAELLALNPDVVHIVTPPATHADLARQAISAGCHVYVEKPFTPTREEAVDVLALAEKRGVSVCPGHQVLFESPALAALELLPQLGRLVHVESYFSFRTARRTITPVAQAKDILPHAVYPLVQQMRLGTDLDHDRFELAGLDVRAEGDVYALVRLGGATGVLMVTLNGRPVEHYQHVVGTNGWLRADYISGSLTKVLGPVAGPSVLFTAYRRAVQGFTGATRGIWRLIFGRAGSYPGLFTLVDRFYERLQQGSPSPLPPRSIVDTVEICEAIGTALDEAERKDEEAARTRLAEQESALPPLLPGQGVLVTGGTGLLGRKVVEELRRVGLPVRALARRLPRFGVRVPGVEYVAADLARPLERAVMAGIGAVAHCAAETSGGKDDQKRNSVDATRNLLEAAGAAGVTRCIHVSSLGILKPGREVGGPLDESSPVDAGNPKRGPYVWGKAESELLAQRLGRELGLQVKVIRPGPLVDFNAFEPPGRLGRELGSVFVAVGGKRTPLSVCDVTTAAQVIRSYVEEFDAAPALVNLVEAPAPTRAQLVGRLRAVRPDLRVRWLPAWLLRLMSGPLKLAQRWLMHSKQPLDVYAAFASERYRTDVAAGVIQKANRPAPLAPVGG